MAEVGPIYGVELLKELPLGSGGFFQALPGADELRQVARNFPRVAAGYEVVLRHLQEQSLRDKQNLLRERLLQGVAGIAAREIAQQLPCTIDGRTGSSEAHQLMHQLYEKYKQTSFSFSEAAEEARRDWVAMVIRKALGVDQPTPGVSLPVSTEKIPRERMNMSKRSLSDCSNLENGRRIRRPP